MHMVSDSTGETVSSVARSVLSQFDDIEPEEHMWALVRTKGQMEKVVEAIEQNPGIVLYTVIDEEMQKILLRKCKELKVPCVSVLARTIRELTAYTGVEMKAQPGIQHELDEEYFERVEAINYTLAHDDGQNYDTLDEADIVIIGASRTSKTPTCIYMSYRGLKIANIPFVKGIPLPDELFQLKGVFIAGLVISPERLLQIRKSRLVSLNENRETSYIDIDNIKQEVQESRRLYNKHKWPVIDVTRKSVEEVAANIMQLYTKFREGG